MSEYVRLNRWPEPPSIGWTHWDGERAENLYSQNTGRFFSVETDIHKKTVYVSVGQQYDTLFGFEGKSATEALSLLYDNLEKRGIDPPEEELRKGLEHHLQKAEKHMKRGRYYQVTGRAIDPLDELFALVSHAQILANHEGLRNYGD